MNVNFIPKKYQDRVYSIYRENGLIDNCKYILYFNSNYTYDGYTNIPVKSKKEVLHYVKNAYKEEECLE